ncbi:MAG: FAD:protein FMN transferase [Myxococcales bacterium]|nr:FAD:protein FMN transferase [Myxococcales bacterium]
MPPPDPNVPPWKKLRPLPVVFVLGLFFLVWWRGQTNEQAQNKRRVEPVQTQGKHTLLRGQTMGTTFTVKLSGVLPEPHSQALLGAVRQELGAVDKAMSTYKPDSELSRFNQLLTDGSLVLSEQTTEVLQLALTIGKDSGGAFDVTVGPLVRAWGFGAKSTNKGPDEATIAKLKALTGAAEQMQFDPKTRALRKKTAGVEVDFSAIAKGYGVDRVAERLIKEGVPGFMVEVGGEVRTFGKRADDKPWRIGIEQPNPAGGGIATVVTLGNLSLATSGDYRNYREVNGKRVSHTIDPRTGHPIAHKLASVSVLAKSCARADAWATALNVLGPTEGLALANKLDLAAYFLVRQPDGQFAGSQSAKWPER